MTVAKQNVLVDWEQVETRQTSTGWELLCPECKRWVKALLATEQGSMCAVCWDRARRMLVEDQPNSLLTAENS